jgi:hypothetical protein
MSYQNNLLASLLSTDESRKRTAWANATPIPNTDDRMDCDGRIIKWAEYGQLTTYGWEIDHINPSCLGGPDVLSNLRARHHLGNRSAGGILGALIGRNRG